MTATHPAPDVDALREEVAAVMPASLAHALEATVATYADSPAYADDRGPGRTPRTLTWRELRETALDLAAALVDLGVEPGDRVAIMATNRLEHVLADVAAVHAGAVPMSVYNTLSGDQVAYVASHARPALVVLEDAGHVARWEQARADGSVPRAVVLEPDAALEGASSWSELLERGRTVRAEHAGEVERRWRSLAHDDTLTVLYTSGTTGHPKGVNLTHGNVLFEVFSSNRTAALEERTVGVSYLPFAHIAERNLGLYIPQVRGGEVHLVRDPAELLPTLTRVRPTAFFGVPRVWEKLQTGIQGLLGAETDEAKRTAVAEAMAVGLAHVESQQVGHTTSPELEDRFAAADREVLRPIRSLLGLDRVTWAGSASAPMPLETARFFAGLGMAVYDIYGLTETTGSVTACGPDAFKLGTVGRPVPGVEMAVADDGELLARGPVTTVGYVGDPEATRRLLDADGWLHTGDIGAIDDDGFVTVLDRKKEMIITSSGKNVAPSNIENLLKESPLVGHALAYGDARPYVVAILTLDPDVAPVVAQRLGLGTTDLAELARHPAVLELVEKGVAAANARLSRPEQVKRWSLLPVEWTADSEELTPTLKLKRRVVHRTYAEEIARLYAS
ncbi:MAG: long-chain fatty acid--CoA ligase [Marmoricola sp.]|nr:long-chain fatty acid--CoA ligase [Marmoricola sp.]